MTWSRRLPLPFLLPSVLFSAHHTHRTSLSPSCAQTRAPELAVGASRPWKPWRSPSPSWTLPSPAVHAIAFPTLPALTSAVLAVPRSPTVSYTLTLAPAVSTVEKNRGEEGEERAPSIGRSTAPFERGLSRAAFRARDRCGPFWLLLGSAQQIGPARRFLFSVFIGLENRQNLHLWFKSI